ncbi:hypothetical protein [Spirochaeta africana]|uniref:Uncharacterized protein n=1 Tax=Spirochaeta africana (strain ATCC 700263 / DSM 8902 / Z-7692) TaxID=889378 RepID=H9UIG5_SPIAZ|nr:hypothetical protein [Spirochaeta africana]AFG37308.1 hypothetical protein Spiaf_1230 [Spirochaeta africana DSM 8902]
MHVSDWKQRTGLLIILAVLAGGGNLYAQEEEMGWWGSYYTPGNLTAGLVAGLGLDYGVSLDLYPNVETKFYKLRPANLFAIDFGIGARGGIHLYTGDDWYPGYTGFSAGPYLSWHLGFRGVENLGITGLEYLARLDLFSSVGINYQLFMGDNAPSAGLGLTTFSGLNYFLTDNLALTLSTTYNRRFTTYSGSRRLLRPGIGVLLKLGPKERLADAPDIAIGAPVYLYFQAYYLMAMGLSGGFFDEQSFSVGDETTFTFVFSDEDEDDVEFTVVRTLLYRNDDASRMWWRLGFTHDDMEGEPGWPHEFEALTNAQHDILRVRYIDPNTNRLTEYRPDDPSRWRRTYAHTPYDRTRLEDYFVRTEQVQVPAGSFTADRHHYAENDYEYTFWVAMDVPGLLIKVEGIDIDGQSFIGELQRIRRGVGSPWEPAW